MKRPELDDPEFVRTARKELADNGITEESVARESVNIRQKLQLAATVLQEAVQALDEAMADPKIPVFLVPEAHARAMAKLDWSSTMGVVGGIYEAMMERKLYDALAAAGHDPRTVERDIAQGVLDKIAGKGEMVVHEREDSLFAMPVKGRA